MKDYDAQAREIALECAAWATIDQRANVISSALRSASEQAARRCAEIADEIGMFDVAIEIRREFHLEDKPNV